MRAKAKRLEAEQLFIVVYADVRAPVWALDELDAFVQYVGAHFQGPTRSYWPPRRDEVRVRLADDAELADALGPKRRSRRKLGPDEPALFDGTAYFDPRARDKRRAP
jgi:hypothetical protein